MADHHYTRQVAESLLNSVSNQNRNISHSQSVNLVAEELIAGHRVHGRMSTVRRFFCLFITFDILFTSLMWLICVMMRGETLQQIFDKEILHYNIKSSLFDIIVVALCRFLILLVFYAILHIDNWSVIALSTGGTCAFLLGKVFVYDWPNAPQPVYQVFLILASFTIAWGEAWFLDFRVLPQEYQAKSFLEVIANNGSSERTPLLHSRAGAPQSTFGESTVAWFSPADTPASSPRFRRPGDQVILTQEQIDEYKSKAAESVACAWNLIHQNNWKLEKKGSVKGDVVESIHSSTYGKVYRFTGIVDCPAKFLFEEFKTNITRLSEWNPTIIRSELIKQISPIVDLTYQITAGGGGGIITPRDFTILRQTCGLTQSGAVQDGEEEPYCFITSGISVPVPGYPPSRDYVRGNNKIACWFMKPVNVRTSAGRVETKSHFQWLMCCDLNGKIPQFVLDRAFSTVMLDYIVYVRRFAADSKAKCLF